MTSSLRASARYWIAGLLLAGTGVVTNRLVAPGLAGRASSLAALIGELTALAGLGVIMIGIKRRITRATRADSNLNTSTP
jgi:hypothetical protein